MSTPSNQRFVLDLLETGKIDTSEAEWLLESIDPRMAKQTAAPSSSDPRNKIILEIDADQKNLQTVIEKLNQAVCTEKDQNKKPPFLHRLTNQIRTG